MQWGGEVFGDEADPEGVAEGFGSGHAAGGGEEDGGGFEAGVEEEHGVWEEGLGSMERDGRV